MIAEEKIQILIELHTEIQHFLELYNWGKEHDLDTDAMQSLKTDVSTIKTVMPILEKEIRDNDYLPEEPNRDASDIEQLFILFQKEIIEDSGNLHSEHIQTSRKKIDEIARQSGNHEYSTSTSEAISSCKINK